MNLGYTYIEVDERLSFNSAPTLLSVSQYFGVVPRSFISEDEPRADNFEKYKVCREGDLILNRFNAYRGSLGRAKERGIVSPDYLVLRPVKEWDSSYLDYLLRSDPLANYMKQHMGGIGAADPDSSGFSRISAKALARFEMELVPRLEEQHQIVTFLDRETTKIDALIDKQEQLIATLREDRAATITQAVTRGLNQSVKLQYTGIAVMDAIPSHWSLRKLKHLAGSFEQGVSPQASTELATEGWGVLKSGCVNGGVFRDIEHKKLPQDFEFDGRLAVAVGDLLVCRASGSPNLVGSAAIVQKLGYQLILSDKIFRLTPNRRSSLDYLEWALNARPYREQVLGAISGAEGLANNLPLSSLRNFWFAVPPIAEQQEIARFLGERCTKIDTLIAKSTEMIETLREYRSALITNAVTGKIDVREAV